MITLERENEKYSEQDIVVFNYDKWPEGVEGAGVQFRLIYQGKLPTVTRASNRTKEKHEIRKVFHKQLVELWNVHPYLKEYVTDYRNGPIIPAIQHIGNQYARCGYRFVPLVGGRFSIACALDILFLRRDHPGALIKHGGDIDNHIKVLFDALRMLNNCSELCNEPPAPDEDPFFCLLEDDRLITEVKIATDRLLTPVSQDESVNDVHLIIHVRTLIIDGDRHIPAGFVNAFS